MEVCRQPHCHTMMGTVDELSDSQYDNTSVSAKQSVTVHPRVETSGKGKSVGYALSEEVRYWFPIRATHHRAQKVYERMVELHNGRLTPYLPTLCRLEYSNEDVDHPSQQVKEEPLDGGLLFVQCTVADFRELLQHQIPGLTPYYNHFATNEFGRNEYLVVPDRQMESFRIIVESRNQEIIVRQADIPNIIEGDRVMVADGPFAGVEGIVMKHKHQKRVFVQLQGIGTYATAYVPEAFLRKIEI